MSAELPSPNRTANPVIPAEYSKIGVLMFASMVILSLWIAYDGAANFLVPAYRAQSVYIQTEAIVLETDLDGGRHKGQERCHPRVRLSYDAGGETHEAWTYLDWAVPSNSRKGAEENLRAYPVGGRVTPWYDPDQPSRVVVTREVGFTMGWTMVSFGLLVPVPTILIVIVIPLVALALRARRGWIILEQTSGRVVVGEVREGRAFDKYIVFWPVLVVEYDHRADSCRGEIRGTLHSDRSAADAELATLLSAHPIGEQRSLWYDPSDRTQPTFEPPLSFSAFLLAGTRILLRPVLAMIAGAFELASCAWRILTCQNRHKMTGHDVSPCH